MNRLPTISILTTCYNREKYLSQCIQSVLDGHYQDFELIIVDDQSTDSSLQIARSYAERDKRIRVIQNEQNLGDYPNRNKAASYAQGKYIKYLDADDMHGRFILDIMIDAMEMHPSAGYGLFDYSENKPLFPISLTPEEAFEAHYSGKFKIFNRSPISAIIRKDIFDAVGGFSGQQHVGDFDLWHRLSSSHNTVLMSAGPSYWRKHDDQQSKDNRTNPLVPFKYQLLALQYLEDEKCPLGNQQRLQYLQAWKRQLARTILYSLKRNGATNTLRLKKASELSWREIFHNAFS